MGFINFRGGQKKDNFQEISQMAKEAEQAEQEKIGSSKRRLLAAEYFGVPTLAEKDNKAILAKIIIDQKSLANIHRELVANNQLTKFFDDTQLCADFWVASITEILDQGRLNNAQKINCLQLLMLAFQLNNQTKASDHYINIARNEKYKNYMDRCFGLDNASMPQFWYWLEHLGNQGIVDDGKHGRNRMDTVMYFIQEYMSFMMTLSFYISQLFPGCGCGKDTKQLLQDKLELMSLNMSNHDFMTINISGLVNPLYDKQLPDADSYTGYSQSEGQADGIAGAFDTIKAKFGKNKRVQRVIWLLDSCVDNESNSLENEYMRMTNTF